MDEIADCIADHQYNKALQQNTDGEQNPADSIIDLMPEPRYFLRALHELEVVPEEYNPSQINAKQKETKLGKKKMKIYNETLEQLKKIKEEDFLPAVLLKTSIGRYFLKEAVLIDLKAAAAMIKKQKSQSNITSGVAKGKRVTTSSQTSAQFIEARYIFEDNELEKLLKLMDKFWEVKSNWEANNASKPTKLASLIRVIDDNRVKPFEDEIDKLKQTIDESNLDELAVVNSMFADVFSLVQNIGEVLLRSFETLKNTPKLAAMAYRSLWFVRFKNVELDDYVVFRDLGRGAFGVVSGARHRITGKMIAIKTMNRKVIKSRRCKKLVIEEKNTLELLGKRPSEFTIGLQYAFYDKLFLYLVLPLLTGGDLSYHLGRVVYRQMKAIRGSMIVKNNNKIMKMTEEERVQEFTAVRGFAVSLAIFYSAEIFLGMTHLHNLGFIYRDLKPENVLLSEDGHAKISDLGLAVQTNTTPDEQNTPDLHKGRAGTPGYWPPEMINSESYGFDADWWAYGCTMYELFYAACPFSDRITGNDERDTCTLNNEVNCLERPLPEPDLSNVCPNQGVDLQKSNGFEEKLQNLLNRLLHKDRGSRIGVMSSPRYTIRTHPCFATIDWPGLEALAVKPPWCPAKDNINAEEQSDIEMRNREHEFRKVKLGPEDDEWIQKTNFVNELNYQKDLVDYLRLERSNALKHLKREADSSMICTLL